MSWAWETQKHSRWHILAAYTSDIDMVVLIFEWYTWNYSRDARTVLLESYAWSTCHGTAVNSIGKRRTLFGLGISYACRVPVIPMGETAYEQLSSGRFRIPIRCITVLRWRESISNVGNARCKLRTIRLHTQCANISRTGHQAGNKYSACLIRVTPEYQTT